MTCGGGHRVVATGSSRPCFDLPHQLGLGRQAHRESRERIRDYGVLKAIGLTPTQITSTVVSAHAALAVVASLLAIPLGIGLYLALFRIAGDASEDAVLAPWWALALIPIGTVLVVVAATSLPARLCHPYQHCRGAPLRVTNRRARLVKVGTLRARVAR